ncbi:MAG: peptidase domain-containing ABC transporter [Bacteroidales bacterium]
MRTGLKIQQHSKYDCGAACLASIAAWYGIKMPLAKIRTLCGCTPQGITIKGIIEGAAAMGLSAKAYKSVDKSITAIAHITTPIIAHIKNDDDYLHFVTIYKFEKSHIIIMDPALGSFINISYKKFTEQWCGYIILIVPGNKFEKRDETNSIFLRLTSILYFHKKEILLSLAGSAVLIVVGIGNSIFLQQIIDKAIPQGNKIMLIAISLIIFTLMSASLYIGYARTMFLIRNSIKIDTRLISCYIGKLFKLPIEFFYRYPTGDINSRVSDVFKIRTFISEGLMSVLISIITLISAFVIMFFYNNKLAILISLFIPFYIGLYYLSGYINKKYNRQLAICGAKFESEIIDSLNGIMSIKHFGAEKLSIGKIEKSYVDMAYKLNAAGRAINIFETFGDGITKSLLATILLVGGLSVLNNQMSIGELVSFYTLSSFFTAPLNNLVNINGMLTQAIVSSERLFEIIDLEEEEIISSNILEYIPNNTTEITISNISFSYIGRDTLFSNLNFTIPFGKITALHGISGCGKSTIGALLLRDFELKQGKILIGNTNIKNISLKLWRNYITIVPQKNHLFNCSLLENITSGDSDPNINNIMDICSSLNLGPLIQKLPLGLMTNIGKEGITLSGGECQKISIARALYKDPQIIIFDEATSFLDSDSEKYVLNKIIELKENGKTIIMITHKTSNIQYADKIINI